MILLSWPDPHLSPNARKDRRAIAAIRAVARHEGWVECLARRVTVPADAHLQVTFFPPDKRRRDLDNMFASIKSHLDGIADASKVDDAGWTFTLRRSDPVPGGAVEIRVLDEDGAVSIPIVGEVS